MKGRTTALALAVVALVVLFWTGVGVMADPSQQRSNLGGKTTAGGAGAGAVASRFSYQGSLTDRSGNPLDGTYSMRFQLYGERAEGTLLWDSGLLDVVVDGGLFSIALSADHSLFDGQELWLEVAVAGEELPRQQILPVPYALSLRPGTVISDTSPTAVLSSVNMGGPAIIGIHGGGIADGSVANLARDLSNSEAAGIAGRSTSGPGAFGMSNSGDGVYGSSLDGNGVTGQSVDGDGGSFASIDGVGVNAASVNGLAGLFEGDVAVQGVLSIEDGLVVAGGKVRIDQDGEIYARSVHTLNDTGATTSGVDSDGNATYESVTSRGDLHAGGTKHAVVPTRGYGPRKLYTDESTEVYFFERGQGQLVRGEVTIELDDVYLETVTVSERHPLLVQVTLTADCNGVFIAEKTATSFTVRELSGGTSNATFDWEVAAKRKGYEDERLGAFTWGASTGPSE